MTTVLLLLCHILPFSQSAPEPDTHLHVYLPPEGGKTPNTGGGEMNPAPSQRLFDYSSARMGRNGQGLQSRGYDYAGGILESHNSGFIDANEIWDPNTKWKCGSSGIKLNEPKDEIIGGRVAEPHAFPWMVRITGGCTKRNCGGALITSKHVLTAYHCTFAEGEREPCDHSDGERMAIIGQNERKANKGNARGIMVPIIGAKFPEDAGFSSDTDSVDDHDFAMYILKDQIVFRKDILPICLPSAGADYAGSRAVAAGWGSFTTNDDQSPWTKEQSPLLKRVDLMVSSADFEHTKMLGTVLEEPSENGRGEWQDPCSGDGGGPLMLPARGTERWVIIGTVYGGGYNCKTGKTSKFEGEEVGIWNKVSAHTEWILDQLEEKDDDSTTTPGTTTTTITITVPAIVRDQPGGEESAQNPSEGADYNREFSPERGLRLIQCTTAWMCYKCTQNVPNSYYKKNYCKKTNIFKSTSLGLAETESENDEQGFGKLIRTQRELDNCIRKKGYFPNCEDAIIQSRSLNIFPSARV